MLNVTACLFKYHQEHVIDSDLVICGFPLTKALPHFLIGLP